MESEDDELEFLVRRFGCAERGMGAAITKGGLRRTGRTVFITKRVLCLQQVKVLFILTGARCLNKWGH